ncbi:MAG: hypothetical protein GY711_29435 [bacterium]|nr:hypothetical protein [bacterium]
MNPNDVRDVELADALLTALGLNSITMEPKPLAEQSPVASLGETSVYGVSHYSTKNRDALLHALQHRDRPETLGELRDALYVLAKKSGSNDASAVLAAVRSTLERQPEGAKLEEFARSGPGS